jgi:hypothetical protein
VMTNFCPEGYVPTPSIVDSSLDGDPSVQNRQDTARRAD